MSWKRALTYLENTEETTFNGEKFSRLLEKIERSGDINRTDDYGQSLLVRSLQLNHQSAFLLLLQKTSIDALLTDDDDLDALLHAIGLSDFFFVEKLVTGRFVDHRRRRRYKSGLNALDYVIQMDIVRLDIYLLLLENGFDSSFKFKGGASHLHKMALLPVAEYSEKDPFYEAFETQQIIQMQLDAAERLMETGISSDEKDDSLCTPIHLSCLKNNKQLLELLLENYGDELMSVGHGHYHGAVSIEDSNGLTPLMYCCLPSTAQNGIECLKLLHTRGADLFSSANVKLFGDEIELSPLMFAFSFNSPMTAQQQYVARYLLLHSAANDFSLVLDKVVEKDADIVLREMMANNLVLRVEQLFQKLIDQFLLSQKWKFSTVKRNTVTDKCINLLLRNTRDSELEQLKRPIRRRITSSGTVHLLKLLCKRDPSILFKAVRENDMMFVKKILIDEHVGTKVLEYKRRACWTDHLTVKQGARYMRTRRAKVRSFDAKSRRVVQTICSETSTCSLCCEYISRGESQKECVRDMRECSKAVCEKCYFLSVKTVNKNKDEDMEGDQETKFEYDALKVAEKHHNVGVINCLVFAETELLEVLWELKLGHLAPLFQSLNWKSLEDLERCSKENLLSLGLDRSVVKKLLEYA